MSTTATPSETPSSGSTSARARLMPRVGSGNACIIWHFVTRPSKQSGTSFGAPWVTLFVWRIFSAKIFLNLRLAQNYMARNLTE